MVKNEKCVVSDSVVCKWLDRDCGACYINDFDDDDEAIKVLENFKVTISLLPKNFDDLQKDECQFCKAEKNKSVGYAIIDMANSEPGSKKSTLFGFGKKAKQRIGSLLPLSISICKECKRSFRLVETIKVLSIVVFAAIAILLIIIPSIAKEIDNISSVLPYGVLLIGGVAGLIVGKVTSVMYMKSKSDRMRFNVYDLPVCRQMKELGWFTLQDNGIVTKFIFSKKSLTRKMKDIKGGNNSEEVFSQTSFLNH